MPELTANQVSDMIDSDADSSVIGADDNVPATRTDGSADCPNCDNCGFTVHSYRGEAKQEQCQWCYAVPNSVFNTTNELTHE